ncbi:MAG: glycosyltransferase family 25 protein [Chthoniobacterales bacterium]
MSSIHAYIINLDRDPSRWKHIQEAFQGTSLQLFRVSAVDGNRLILPSAEFDTHRFRRLHGRAVNIYEIACYLSHMKAIQAFLKTEEEYALICEDDIFVESGLENAITAALEEKDSWNILRLTALCPGHPVVLKKITKDYSLSLQFGRMKGAGAYIVDRKAANAFMKHLLPMWLPWDHAFDREWFFGLKALGVTPFPISQTREHFPSTIQKNSQAKLSTFQRCCTTYPYQAFNEISRYLFRLGALVHYKAVSLLPRKSNEITTRQDTHPSEHVR